MYACRSGRGCHTVTVHCRKRDGLLTALAASHVSLHLNNIGDAGCSKLAEALAVSCSLRELGYVKRHMTITLTTMMTVMLHQQYHRDSSNASCAQPGPEQHW